MQQVDKHGTAWAAMMYENTPMSEVFGAVSDENVRAWRALPRFLVGTTGSGPGSCKRLQQSQGSTSRYSVVTIVLDIGSL